MSIPPCGRVRKFRVVFQSASAPGTKLVSVYTSEDPYKCKIRCSELNEKLRLEKPIANHTGPVDFYYVEHDDGVNLPWISKVVDVVPDADKKQRKNVRERARYHRKKLEEAGI